MNKKIFNWKYLTVLNWICWKMVFIMKKYAQRPLLNCCLPDWYNSLWCYYSFVIYKILKLNHFCCFIQDFKIALITCHQEKTVLVELDSLARIQLSVATVVEHQVVEADGDVTENPKRGSSGIGKIGWTKLSHAQITTCTGWIL